MYPVARSVLAALVVVLSACAPAEPAVAPTAPSSERVAQIREARAAVTEPAVALREGAQLLLARVEALRLELGTDDAADRAGELLDRPIVALRGAVDAARAVALPSGPDAAAAGRALDDAASAAEELIAAADDERRELADLAEVDARLVTLTAVWDEPGSRSQQLERFASIASEAEELAADLDDREPLHTCSTAYARRAELARHVATVTRELRDHVARYEGRAFDDRRAELAQDPLGTGGTPPAATDVEELTACWPETSAAVAAAARLDAALAALETALNPGVDDPAGPVDPSS